MIIRVMFDACTPRPLRKLFPTEFVVSTAQELGWAELGNGSLQAAAATEETRVFQSLIESENWRTEIDEKE